MALPDYLQDTSKDFAKQLDQDFEDKLGWK